MSHGKAGQTEYPMIDAAMRELYDTGWMPQILRMVVASFIVEYLHVDWYELVSVATQGR